MKTVTDVTDEIYCDWVRSTDTSSVGRRTHLGSRLLALAFLSLTVAAGQQALPPSSGLRLAATSTTTSAASPHRFRQLTSDADFAAGAGQGVWVGGGALTLSSPTARRSLGRTRWAYGRWTSPVLTPGRSFTQVVPSWDAVTPAGTFLEVQVRGLTASGVGSSWKTMARWSSRDASFRRTSLGAQSDAFARANTDTFTAQPGVVFTGYQLQVLLHRRVTSRATPTLRSIGAVASTPTGVPAVSTFGGGPRALRVPAYSQMVHRGQYRQYGGGGEAWCSPTSLSMLLGYYGALPPASTYSWVSKRYADRWVDHVARSTYDFGYHGTGNWSFNAAYATNRGLDAFVTRLTDLRQAERFIAAGIPLEASIAFGPGQLSGAPIGSTAGHLVVITGFTSAGNVIVNDPAAASDASVTRVYNRAQFERAWQSRSSGTVYVVHDAAHPLPARDGSQAW